MIEAKTIMMSRNITGKSVELFRKGTKKLVKVMYKQNGRCEWAQSIKQGSGSHAAANSSGRPQNGQTVFYHCSKTGCGKLMASNNGLFLYDNVDYRIRCMHCKATMCSHTWTCACNTPWFACNEHAGNHPQKMQSSFATQSLNRKRKAATSHFQNLSHEQLM